jgi:hypothetical protein
MTIFGRIIAAPHVEEAVEDALKLWLSTYLAEVERQNDIEAGAIRRPRSFVTTIEQDVFPGEQLPSIVTISPGLAEDPEREDASVFSAWWNVTVCAVVQASSEKAARAMAGYYAAAIRAALVQHQSLDGFADAVQWISERYEGAQPGERNRSQAVGLVDFRVRVSDVLTQRAGPLEPEMGDLSPYPDYPEVETTAVTVDNDPPDTPLDPLDSA